MDLELLEHLTPEQLPAVIPSFLAGYLTRGGEVAERSTRELTAGWTLETQQTVLHSLRHLGDEARLYRAHPALRELSRMWCELITQGSEVSGIEHLQAAVEAGPTVIVGNHLSYVDTSCTDAVLVASGHGDLADKIVAAAGPKVYETLFRRFASACLNTLKVPQSTSLGHTAQLPRRELARRALASLKAAESLQAEGMVLLIYPEGSRTRTGRLGPFLKGVHRYLRGERVQVVPLAVRGTEVIMPLGQQLITPGKIEVRIAPPIPVRDTVEALVEARSSLIHLLPPEQRPEPGSPALH